MNDLCKETRDYFYFNTLCLLTLDILYVLSITKLSLVLLNKYYSIPSYVLIKFITV